MGLVRNDQYEVEETEGGDYEGDEAEHGLRENEVGDVESNFLEEDMDHDLPYLRSHASDSEDEGPSEDVDEDGLRGICKVVHSDAKVRYTLKCKVVHSDAKVRYTVKCKVFHSDAKVRYTIKCKVVHSDAKVRYTVKCKVVHSDAKVRYTVKCKVVHSDAKVRYTVKCKVVHSDAKVRYTVKCKVVHSDAKVRYTVKCKVVHSDAKVRYTVKCKVVHSDAKGHDAIRDGAELHSLAPPPMAPPPMAPSFLVAGPATAADCHVFLTLAPLPVASYWQHRAVVLGSA
ncbi:hypothetical protein QYE76_069762 [Lolium multiflorum]|uniref:Uncharacterized protein n=1 Tax=Lolium multiflorum TaxID=4521 RepID=A0AAD8SIW6_LOLMU|nr:hypothetical protein QYE76_069762 [Lolium multiflorum]